MTDQLQPELGAYEMSREFAEAVSLREAGSYLASMANLLLHLHRDGVVADPDLRSWVGAHAVQIEGVVSRGKH